MDQNKLWPVRIFWKLMYTSKLNFLSQRDNYKTFCFQPLWQCLASFTSYLCPRARSWQFTKAFICVGREYRSSFGPTSKASFLIVQTERALTTGFPWKLLLLFSNEIADMNWLSHNFGFFLLKLSTGKPEHLNSGFWCHFSSIKWGVLKDS